jgi:hypothetical protein
MPLEHFPALVPFAIAVFVLQGLLMVLDEFVFHRRREMPRWERIGHPLDTLTVLIPILFALWLSPSSTWKPIFFALALFSSLFVTKDEWVHARLCGPFEQWLHAVLFLLHPVLFLMIFLLWTAGATEWLIVQAVIVSVFLAWQTFYWNGPWAPRINSL